MCFKFSEFRIFRFVHLSSLIFALWSVICLHLFSPLVACCQRTPVQTSYPSDWTCPTSVPECLVSHLTIIEFRGYEGSRDEQAFTAYTLQSGLVLKTVTLRFPLGLRKKYSIVKELCVSPRASSMCQLKFDWLSHIPLGYVLAPSLADWIKAVLNCMVLQVSFVVCLKMLNFMCEFHQILVYKLLITSSQILSCHLTCCHGQIGTNNNKF